ncbi:hypothetical protein EYF80_028577 [Liparis tanakae]|uniref:Uncharacterized protein n=1 Tax=Liparis tanakae TaxID=230148 RepID=A0A4Z2H8V3_9TELE|nr:hypothetical protein EYF80_028577 [Liparis tanakae]
METFGLIPAIFSLFLYMMMEGTASLSIVGPDRGLADPRHELNSCPFHEANVGVELSVFEIKLA